MLGAEKKKFILNKNESSVKGSPIQNNQEEDQPFEDDQLIMDQLLGDWGIYERLKAKVENLFSRHPQNPGRAKEKLSELNFKIVYAYLVEGKRFAEIGRELNMDWRTVKGRFEGSVESLQELCESESLRSDNFSF